MTAEETISLLSFGMKQELEDKMFLRWIIQSQFEVSFEEFMNQFKHPVMKDEKEIYDDVENILNAMR